MSNNTANIGLIYMLSPEEPPYPDHIKTNKRRSEPKRLQWILSWTVKRWFLQAMKSELES